MFQIAHVGKGGMCVDGNQFSKYYIVKDQQGDFLLESTTYNSIMQFVCLAS